MRSPSDPSLPDKIPSAQETAGHEPNKTEVLPAQGNRLADTVSNYLHPIVGTPQPEEKGLSSSGRPHSTQIQNPAVPPAEKLPWPFGEYELIQEIARGGMGVVYKARQPALDRIVALKMILEGQLTSDASIQRFYREARASAALDHPNIVPIYDIGYCEGRHYFTMAFIEKGSLKSLIQKRGPLSAPEAAAMTAAIAQGVAFAHQRGVIHRDLKPDNVLIDPDGRPRITDFGLAKQVSDDSGLTASGVILGTPAYMAPEQALGGKRNVGPAADIYALGSILYFLLTGRPPFQGDTLTEILCRVVKDAPQPPRQIKPEIPPALEAVCLRCLEKEPEARYASAAELAEALSICGQSIESNAVNRDQSSAAGNVWAPRTPESDYLVPGTINPDDRVSSNAAFADGATTEPPVPRWSGQQPRLRKPGRWKLVGAALVLMALAVGLAGIIWQNQQDAVARDPFIPQANRQDFKVELKLVGKGIAQKEDGTWQLRNGQGVRYQLEVGEDCYVGVWDCRADGEIVQVFPNELDRDFLVKKGQPRSIPPEEAGDYVVQSAPRPEHLYVLATTEPWDPLIGQKEGPFAVLKTVKERERLLGLIGQQRKMVLRPVTKAKPVLLAEEVLRYHVEPAKK